jgi:hypothetical protein
VYWSLTALGQWHQNNIVGYYTDYLGSWSVLASDPGACDRVESDLSVFWRRWRRASSGRTWARAVYLGWKLAPVFLLIGAFPWIVVVWRALRFNLLAVFLAGYGGLLLLWPWPPARFLLPVLRSSWFSPATRRFGSRGRSCQRSILGAQNSPVDHGGCESRCDRTVRPARARHWIPVPGVFQIGRCRGARTKKCFPGCACTARRPIGVASALDSMVFLYTDRPGNQAVPPQPRRAFLQQHPVPRACTAAEVFETLTTSGPST